MPEANVKYFHMVSLGGRRKPKPDSKNAGWRLDAFRAYADYMEMDAFQSGIKKLEDID